MKEKYKGKIKVPFCIKYSDSIHRDLEALFSELLGENKKIGGAFDYYGLRSDGVWGAEDDPTYFGENATIYTLEELQAIVDSVEGVKRTPMEKGDRFSIKSSLGQTGTWYRPNEWYTFHSYLNDDAVVTQEDMDIGVKYGSLYILDKDIDYTSVVKQGTSEASCSDDTATLATDEYVGMGEGETDSMALVGNSTEVKVNLSFGVTIKGQTFTLTTDEIKELYLQLCNAEGVLKDWELGR